MIDCGYKYPDQTTLSHSDSRMIRHETLKEVQLNQKLYKFTCRAFSLACLAWFLAL